ncbi:MAG: SpoIID/LytB domain-containing protein [Planctomycetota bacterium]
MALALTLLAALPGCGGSADNPGSSSPAVRTWDRTPAEIRTPANPASRSALASPAAVHLGGGPYPGPRLEQVPREPALRVRVQTKVESLTIDPIPGESTALRITGSRDSGAKVYRYTLPLTVTLREGAWVLRDAGGRGVRWRLSKLLIECDDGEALKLGDKRYPRRLVLTPRQDAAASGAGLFDVVNHVPLETYLPGVIERELYANWTLETFKAQAVAARSYALWEMTIGRSRHYDLESTTASQVYGGKASNTTAIQAVRATRGQVIAYEGRVVPAFFSSSTGGLGQDALVAFPNRVEDIAPLRAREHGAWDRDSPTYRWGPIVRDTATLSRRIAAWGLRRQHAVEKLGPLQRIEVVARNRVGRPAQFALIDTSGRRVLIACEHLRNACNFTREGEIPLEKGQRLLSSHFDVAVSGGQVRFTTGRGHGHGVGLSQWGAQAMAKAGHGYTAILGFYYPGARVTTIY